MKQIFIEKIIAKIESTRDVSNIEKKRLKYGLEGFYNLFTKLVVIIGLALIFNLIKELLLLILIYSSLRLYGFGIHAKTTWQCWITSVPIYIGGCFFIKYITIPQSISYIIWIFGFLSFLFFSPADTAARPLIHKDKRLRAKILSLSIVIVYLVINLLFTNKTFLNTTLYALVVQSLAMNPLIYKLFNASFNNYKMYEKKV